MAKSYEDPQFSETCDLHRRIEELEAALCEIRAGFESNLKPGGRLRNFAHAVLMKSNAELAQIWMKRWTKQQGGK